MKARTHNMALAAIAGGRNNNQHQQKISFSPGLTVLLPSNVSRSGRCVPGIFASKKRNVPYWRRCWETEVGNARYAFVLENIDLKTTFNVSKRGNHKKLFKAVVNSLMNQFPNGQTCTEQAWINYLGSASACGIGFYKSTVPDKNTFIKLN